MVIQPLLEIFIRSSSPGKETTLNCDECFLVMEYFVELALEGVPQDEIKSALLKHLEKCPDCQKHHMQRLESLESQWKQIR